MSSWMLSKAPASSVQQAMHRTGILLNVDDTEALRYAKTRILQQAGFEVREAATGGEALDLVSEINPPLVLLDVKLPDISGIEVCRQIKVAHPSVSVLQMSATFVTGEFQAAAFDQGADSYLVEPVEPVVLVATVRSLLRLRQSEAQLRQSEEFARSVLEASADCIMVVDPSGKLEYVNPNGLRMLNASSLDELCGRRWSHLWSANAWPVVEQAFCAALRGRTHQLQIRNAISTGDCWDITISPVRTKKGSISQLVATVRDITEQQRASAAANRLAAIVEQSQDAIVSFGLDENIRSWNPGATRLFGYSEQEAVAQSAAFLLGNDDGSQNLNAIRSALNGNILSFDAQSRTKTGRIVDVSVNLAPLRASDGSILGASAIIRDISERKIAEERAHMLMREVNHRAKNLLTVVQAIAHQSAKSLNPKTFAENLTRRLQSLSASQDLIISGNWVHVPIADLVKSQLAPFGVTADRLSIRGDPIVLKPEAAQGIGMAVHELATNAIKYGALSNDRGRIAVGWTTFQEGDRNYFEMTWTEMNGPAVETSTHRGFGRKVIERMAAEAVQGEVDYRFDPEGVRWTLRAPEGFVQLKSNAPREA
jgi:PAS domain S-box-containing protein